MKIPNFLTLENKLYKGVFTNKKGQKVNFTFPKSYIDNVSEKDFINKMRDKYKCII